jgi:hypothetical protein
MATEQEKYYARMNEQSAARARSQGQRAKEQKKAEKARSREKMPYSG